MRYVDLRANDLYPYSLCEIRLLIKYIVDSSARGISIVDSSARGISIVDSGARGISIVDSGARGISIVDSGARGISIVDSGARGISIVDSGARGISIVGSSARDPIPGFSSVSGHVSKTLALTSCADFVIQVLLKIPRWQKKKNPLCSGTVSPGFPCHVPATLLELSIGSDWFRAKSMFISFAFDPDVEESTFVALPRNLSYVQDSYLDRYSVSARYVHNPKAERRFQHELNHHHQSAVNVGSEEDETVGLLSVIKAQDYPVNCSGNNVDHIRPDLSPTAQLYSQPDSPTFNGGAFSTCGSGLSKSLGGLTSNAPSPPALSSFLGPAARVTSKITSLLHSPPNESMDSVRDIGSSVDGDIAPLKESSHGDSVLTILKCPDTLGQKMDRGVTDSVYDSGSARDTDANHSEPGMNSIVIFSNSDEEIDADEQKLSQIVAEMSENEMLLKPFGVGGKTHFPSPHGSHETLNTHVSIKPAEECPSILVGSPDSDGFSEEGVFLNMDDLENTEKSTTVSEVSDDTCVSVDSVFLSPDEAELEEEEAGGAPRKMSLQEAIGRAAIDLGKITVSMYGESSKSANEAHQDSRVSDSEDEDAQLKQSRLARAGRESPVRYPTGLKLNISEQSAPSKESLADSRCESESPLYSENEFNFNRVGLRKSSSLKTNKTPPGTPHRKKVVRFADAMGLDLESVRHVLNMESPPRIPSSALADLKAGLIEDHKEMGSRYLCACFNQPGASDKFVQKVLSQKVCLENAIITDLTITGVVRVSNISFNKSVRVRYTHNSWATFHDIAASYVQNSCDGPTDRFSFSIVAPPYFGPGSQLEFAISYNAGGVEYWDNNDGKNYVFECFAKTAPTENETAWLHFL
ncbi:hypothetical protein Btru_053366 [Bulinus truncatus]|nr:hypothetical protein Btru_053366 [Bulinus truncatus]